MVVYSNSKEKILAAYKLLDEDSTTKEKFESVKELLKGINPKVDQTLIKVSKAWDDLEKIEQGEVIELSAEHLPEDTEEQKKRKKRVLLLIRSWNDLKNEVERVKTELENSKPDGKESFSKITSFAKGPFGIVTILAIVIVVGVSIFVGSKDQPNPETPVSQKSKIKVIEFNGKKIPLSQLTEGIGPECDKNSHYHAKDHSSAQSLDGTKVQDPGGCGFGKVKEVKVLEVE
jgi:hypothetical protein